MLEKNVSEGGGGWEVSGCTEIKMQSKTQEERKGEIAAEIKGKVGGTVKSCESACHRGSIWRGTWIWTITPSFTRASLLLYSVLSSSHECWLFTIKSFLLDGWMVLKSTHSDMLQECICFVSQNFFWNCTRQRGGHWRPTDFSASLEGNLESKITNTNSPKERGHPALCGQAQTRGGDWDGAKVFGFHYIFLKNRCSVSCFKVTVDFESSSSKCKLNYFQWHSSLNI